MSLDITSTNNFNDHEVVKQWKQNELKQEIGTDKKEVSNITIDSIDIDKTKMEEKTKATNEKTKEILNKHRKLAKQKKAAAKLDRINKSKNKVVTIEPITDEQDDAAAIAASPVHTFKDLKFRKEEEILGLRFSQKSVAPQSTQGVDLFDVIKKEGWKKGQQIRVVLMPDEDITSLDNRRVLAVKRIVREESRTFFNDKNALEARCYDHGFTNSSVISDIKNILSNMPNRDEVASVENANLQLTPNSYGAMVYYRMRVGQGNYEAEPYGFTKDPEVRTQ